MDSTIILAGGFGTRLKKIVKDTPKPMAKIETKPFLEILLNYLKNQGIKKIILSVGYKKEIIINYLKNSFNDLDIIYSIEDAPLKTGGAIKKALNLVENDFSFVLNGDTFFDIDLKKFKNFHIKNNADISIALKKLQNFNRYGSVELDNNKIINFNEKKFTKCGYINGGIYILNKNILNNEDKIFSFEEYLSKTDKKIYGLVFDNYFIDIGLPTDYLKAQKELKKWL